MARTKLIDLEMELSAEELDALRGGFDPTHRFSWDPVQRTGSVKWDPSEAVKWDPTKIGSAVFTADSFSTKRFD